MYISSRKREDLIRKLNPKEIEKVFWHNPDEKIYKKSRKLYAKFY